MERDALYFSDDGAGGYRNPVLFCDYSDPDVIRAGDAYYMTASSFNFTPGLPILKSLDLVNWRLVGYALPRIPGRRFDAPCHAQGVWAPSLREHDGWFYIFYGMPDEGIYVVRAQDPMGEWTPPALFYAGKGLIDPCPFWDEDGRAYVVHAYAKSRCGFNGRLGVIPMDGALCASGEDRLLYDGADRHPTIEGPKVYQRNGFYYIFAPAGGVPDGWQAVLRGTSILGPFEDRIVLKQGSSAVNGPHQGAWVETAAGESWFLHFQSRGAYGRVVHLQPMSWGRDGWPRIGQKDPADAPKEDWTCGIPVLHGQKPLAPACAKLSLQASDSWEGALGLQWQFMGNASRAFYSLSARPGFLRLYARPLPGGAFRLWDCPQVLTQKLVCPQCAAAVRLDVAGLKQGEQAGLAVIGGQYAALTVRRGAQGAALSFLYSQGEAHEERVGPAIPLASGQLYLRVELIPTSEASLSARFFFGLNGAADTPLGTFTPERHTWVGVRIGLFALPFAPAGEGAGWADFETFTVTTL